MESYSLQPDRTMASLTHLSTFSKYFFPFGNFIFPLIIWSLKKNDPFVNVHGKQALNFQISVFLYFVILASIGICGLVFMGLNIGLRDSVYISDHIFQFGNLSATIPIVIFTAVIGSILLALFVMEIVCVINATIHASEGKYYNYPLTINFLGISSEENKQDLNETKA